MLRVFHKNSIFSSGTGLAGGVGPVAVSTTQTEATDDPIPVYGEVLRPRWRLWQFDRLMVSRPWDRARSGLRQYHLGEAGAGTLKSCC